MANKIAKSDLLNSENKELTVEEDYVRVSFSLDGNYVFGIIKLDDEQELTLTQHELYNLRKILNKSFNLIKDFDYFD